MSNEKKPLRKAYRPVKFGNTLELPMGKLITQEGPPATGKSTRGRAWVAEAPENRRLVEGDRKEAEILINQGYDVMLNLLPGT